MEVTGFALGVVSTVGILGQIFDGCVKAYAYFTTASNMGRDSERMVCKIRIEEMRLTVWGREWGVAEGKLEAHLAAANGENEQLKKLAEMILKQLLDTIGNTRKLKERYGVKEQVAKSDENGANGGSDPGNKSSWGELKMRTRWVIGDRDKFDVLLRDLKDFNDGLERLFPPSCVATLQRAWTNELLQEAKRDMGQLNLLESASSGVYPQLNTSANLKQLRINLDSEDSARFKPTAALKIPRDTITFQTEGGRRIEGQYRKDAQSVPRPIITEWIDYDADADLDTRLVFYQRVDNLARMVHSASNRHPDLHTLDCIGYFDDTQHSRYGLVYGVPAGAALSSPRTLASLIDNPQLHTPDLDDRFRLAHTLAVALWSFHSLDWLHKTLCSHNMLFFDGDEDAARLARPYVTGFDSARPDHVDEMTVAARNDLGQAVYRHPDSLGVWRQSYRKAFDVYSLGLALLEIGLWRRLRDFHKPKYSPAAFRDKAVLPVLVPRLGSRTGKMYQRVVERCLACDEPADSDGAGKVMEWVVLTLESLKV